MPTSSDIFDSRLAAFKEVQEAPWGHLRYNIAAKNLNQHIAQHLPDKQLNILDVGGGNGLDAIPLAQRGHRVTILDYAPEMLSEGERNAQAQGVTDQLTFHQANVSALPSLFPAPQFDLLLCHNVIQYVEDIPRALQGIYDTLLPGGLISVISINRYSETFRRALQIEDPAGALEALGGTTYPTILFDAEMRVFSGDEMAEMLVEAGFSDPHHYGIRMICDYMPNQEIKFDPEFFAKLEKLEMALSDQHPYRLIARNYQIIAKKK